MAYCVFTWIIDFRFGLMMFYLIYWAFLRSYKVPICFIWFSIWIVELSMRVIEIAIWIIDFPFGLSRFQNDSLCFTYELLNSSHALPRLTFELSSFFNMAHRISSQPPPRNTWPEGCPEEGRITCFTDFPNERKMKCFPITFPSRMLRFA